MAFEVVRFEFCWRLQRLHEPRRVDILVAQIFFVKLFFEPVPQVLIYYDHDALGIRLKVID